VVEALPLACFYPEGRMDWIVEVTADPSGADARLFGLEVEHLPYHASLPVQVSIEPPAIPSQTVFVVGDHGHAEGAIAGDVLTTGDRGCQRLTVHRLEEVQGESGRAVGHAMPAKV